ncbi:hypothetical protein C4571_03810 [Candidatus Parcubacteria bacterium]|nr:MAG: hypothetical protein C4571_03810 [Candidatus Parcubacteria bacterium]
MGLDLENFDRKFERGRAERRLQEIETEGKIAGLQGKLSEENPYTDEPEQAVWERGWKAGKVSHSTSELDHK